MMKRIRKAVRKLRTNIEQAEYLEQRWGDLSEKTISFAKEIRDLGLEGQIADLLNRIERLEAELHPLKNGQPLRRPTYRS